VNFAWRTECRDCQAPRPKGLGPISSSSDRGDKKKQKKKKASSLVEKGVACCYGCGAPLQTLVPAAAGYVDPAKFQAKQKHRQLKQVR
jgi:nitric-oxide synthase